MFSHSILQQPKVNQLEPETPVSGKYESPKIIQNHPKQKQTHPRSSQITWEFFRNKKNNIQKIIQTQPAAFPLSPFRPDGYGCFEPGSDRIEKDLAVV